MIEIKNNFVLPIELSIGLANIFKIANYFENLTK